MSKAKDEKYRFVRISTEAYDQLEDLRCAMRERALSATFAKAIDYLSTPAGRKALLDEAAPPPRRSADQREVQIQTRDGGAASR